MKKNLKSIAAVVLSAAMMLSMSLTAFATSTKDTDATMQDVTSANADSITSSVQVSMSETTENDTLKMYKIVDVSLSTANELTYSFTQAFSTFLATDAAGEYQNKLDIEKYEKMTSNGTDLNKLLGLYTSYLRSSDSIQPYKTATTDGKATFETVDLGQYIIIGAGNPNGAYIYSPVSAEVVPSHSENGDKFELASQYDVTMKMSKNPTGDKTVTDTKKDGDKETASIGDTLHYTLTATVPTYPDGATNTTFFMQDTLSNGLTLSSDSNAIVVKGYTTADPDPIQLTLNDQYTITITGQTLYINYDYSKIKQYVKLTAEYGAVLNENAKVGTEAGNPNTYDLIYSTNPFSNGHFNPANPPKKDDTGYGYKEDQKTVFTYALDIEKSAANTNPKKALANATFEIKSGDTVVGTITTDTNGHAAYIGLKAGIYKLHETKAPAGYKLATTDTEVTISASSTAFRTVSETQSVSYTSNIDEAQIKFQARNDKGELLWVNANGDIKTSASQPDDYSKAYVKNITVKVSSVDGTDTTDSTKGFIVQDIADNPGTSLPTTGGMGTVLFTVIGLILMIVAAIVLITKKRMQNK